LKQEGRGLSIGEGRKVMEEKIPETEYPYQFVLGQNVDELEAGGGSEVEHLMNKFESHEGQEREFLIRYKEVAERSKSRFVRFLLQLIISDEEKHHAVTHAMVSTLQGSLRWTQPADAIGSLHEGEEEKDELLKLTRDFIRLEREGVKEYKKLIKDCRDYYHGLFGLLLDTMIQDSEKHIRILQFLQKKLKEA
jgi:bacterioferritin (cytochrome b1)